MKSRIHLFTVLLTLMTFSLALPSQEPRVGSLIQSAGNTINFQTALEQLKSIRDSSISRRREVASELSQRISGRYPVAERRVAMNLAGYLELTELSPVIAQGLDEDTRGGGNGVTGIHQRASLDFDPAVKALVAFGPLAVPSLANELKSGSRIGRFRAVSALSHIKGMEAETLLREQLRIESDPGVRNLISRELNVAQPAS